MSDSEQDAHASHEAEELGISPAVFRQIPPPLREALRLLLKHRAELTWDETQAQKVLKFIYPH